MIDFTEEADTSQIDSQFLFQFAANSFLRALALFDSSARWTMKDNSSKRIPDFSDEKYIFAAEDTKGRLPGLNLHNGAPGVLTILPL